MVSSYILVDGKYEDKGWWNDLVRACAVIGDTFEIHCWSDESAEISAALKFGSKTGGTWNGGVVIKGAITEEFLSFLTDMAKPGDNEIYNKMAPFFTIIFGNRLHSEHYGTEMIISRVVRENQSTVDQILDRMEQNATVHRNLG